MKTKTSLALILLAASAAALFTTKRETQPPSFCDECVMERQVTDWKLFGRVKLFQTAAITATPVSDLLSHHQFSAKHEHRWSAPVYLSETELETSDAPRIRSLGFLNEPRNVSFLSELFSYTGTKDIAAWRDVAWQVNFASALEPALRFLRFPENGFSSRDQFLAWWSQSSYPLFNRLHEVTEAD
jgi:hypothetical protein